MKNAYSRLFRAIVPPLFSVILLAFLLCTNFAYGQVLTNGTLDGPTGCCNAPPNWTNCSGTPDRQIINGTGAGINGINVPPTDGVSYTGYISSLSGYREAIGQPATLVAGTAYSGSMDLFRATSTTFTSWQGNGWMEIWGGSSCANRTELLWASPAVTNVYVWANFPISFTPTQNHSYIIFWNTPNPATNPGCYNCMDNIILSGTVLPAFQKFELAERNEGVDIVWATDPNTEFSHFTVDWSPNGMNFQRLTEKDFEAGTFDYDWFHASPQSGVNHYRLMGYDLNGNLVVNKTETILVDVSQATTIYPSPASTHTAIRFEVHKVADVTLRLFDPAGRLVLQRDGHYAAGAHEIDLALADQLSAGQYRIQLNLGERVEQHSLMIQK
ncbi:MAG: hypothetical protein AAF570_01400 [Bacteroidota bacterium]